MRYLFLFFAVFGLFSQEEPVERKLYWKYHHSASIGYRRDRQEFQTSLAKQLVTDRNSMQLVLGSHLEYRQLVFYMRALYGWLIDGTFADKINDARFLGPMFSQKFSLGSGYSADAIIAGGYRLELLTRKNFAFSLIGSGGYKYSHIMNFPERDQSSSIEGVSGFIIGSIPKPNQQDWFGPLVEGRIEFLLWDNLNWDFFGQYHWVTLRSILKENCELFLFNPAPIPSTIEVIEISSIYKTTNASRFVGGVDIRYNGPTGWNFGAHFEGSSVWTNDADYQQKRKTDEFIPEQTPTQVVDLTAVSKIQWVSYELSLFLGYQF